MRNVRKRRRQHAQRRNHDRPCHRQEQMTSRRCQSRIKANRSAYLDHGKPSTLLRKTLPFQLWNCHEAAKLCLSLAFACCRSIGAGFSSAQMETINLGKEIAFTQGFEGCMLEVLHLHALPSGIADSGTCLQCPIHHIRKMTQKALTLRDSAGACVVFVADAGPGNSTKRS